MAENYSYIPNRLKSAVKGGHVAGASDIIDDTLMKDQQALNADFNTKVASLQTEVADRYTKGEVNSLISSTPETDAIPLSVEEGQTAADVLALVPLAARPNNIFRVINESNTAYTEYGWNAETQEWVDLGTKDYGINDEPEDNDNMVKSKGLLAYYGKYVNNFQNIVYADVDKKFRILLAHYKNGDTFIPGLHMLYDKDVLGRIEILVDAKGKIISFRRKDGTLVEDAIKVNHLNVGDIVLSEEAVAALRSALGGTAGNILTDLEGWQMLLDEYDKLIANKADSLVSLKWTPKAEIPTRANDPTDYYPANVEVEGVPYGATYEVDKRIGFDVSLETFMTAVNNPYSLLYTERIGATTSKSAWGKTYHGVDDYAGPYYGCVCSTFTSYCVGLPAAFLSAYYPRLCEKGVLGRVTPQSAQGAKVGDVIYKEGHCALVRNVKYGDSGVVTSIVVSEQGGKHAYETEYSAEDFDSKRLIDDDATLYRFPTPNRDKKMFSFDSDSYEYNNDICTFAGDKACFREGELIVLNYDLADSGHDWTQILLYKNNELVGTFNISEIDQEALPESQRGHALILPTELSYGDYKARLYDGSDYSGYTEFEIIQTNVTREMVNGGRAVKVDFTSSNATPVDVYICTRVISHGIYILSEEDVQAGSVTIDVDDFLTRYDGTLDIKSGVQYLLKMHFKTDQGRVTNVPISITFNF